MKITAHCLVKNEDQWVWFAIQSVLPFIDQIIVYDTGSTDKTVEMIRSIKSSKIIFEEKGGTDRVGLVKLRQEQLDRTKTDCFFILDGDEIWLRKNFEGLVKTMDKDTVAVVNRVRNCIGDVYHYLGEETGKYEIAGIKGNLNIRLIRKTPTMKVVGEYPLEVYRDKNGAIQDQTERLKVSDCWCLHATYLKRSSFDSGKTSGSFGKARVKQLGQRLSPDELPEVFSLQYPDTLNPLKKRGLSYEVLATAINPALRFKRKLRQ